MFCTKCGSKIEYGQRFCTKCGATVIEDNDEPFPANLDTQKNINIKSLNLYIISALIMLLCGILLLNKTFNIDVFGMAEKFSIFELIEGSIKISQSIAKIITIGLYGITVIFMAVMTLSKHDKTKSAKILPLITACLTILLLIAALIIGMKEAGDWDATFELSTNGILVLLGSCINAFILIKALIKK